MNRKSLFCPSFLVATFFLLGPLGCTPSSAPTEAESAPSAHPGANAFHSIAASDRSANEKAMVPAPAQPMKDIDAWTAAGQMSPAINIGNTLENTTQWETGWGNPVITKQFVESLAKLGFKTVRLPVAWDTYAVDGRITDEKMKRVEEVVDWITGAGMYCVINIHWDGGWIDSSNKEVYGDDVHATFSDVAEKKFRSYWRQIANHFAGKGDKVLFEALNEETKFEGEGSEEKAYATLTRVNQIFIDTVRATGKNNEKRLLVVTGYHTDFEKTSKNLYELPKDPTPNKLFISVHYYTPWTFCGLDEDAEWGKVQHTWGTKEEVAKLNELFDMMEGFSKKHDIPVFVGEYNATEKREHESRVRWVKAATRASLDRKMIPVLWDTGGEVSRKAPHEASPLLQAVLKDVKNSP